MRQFRSPENKRMLLCKLLCVNRLGTNIDLEFTYLFVDELAMTMPCLGFPSDYTLSKEPTRGAQDRVTITVKL